MESILTFLSSNSILVLFFIIFIGIALGSIRVFGLNLGLSGVLFIALVAGHYGLSIPSGIGTLGLAIFVYCVGLSAGNRFFSAIAKQGSKLALLSIAIVGSGALVTVVFAKIFGISGGIAAGIFAGASTSTPALAAATEGLGKLGGEASIGYSIAYPFGVVGVVLFVQLLPRFLKLDLDTEAKKMKANHEVKIESKLVRVLQPNIIGDNISECKLLDGIHSAITRVAKDSRLVPLSPEDIFEKGQEVLLVGKSDTMDRDIAFIGEAVENPYPLDTSKERRKLILTSKSYAGKKLRELRTVKNNGIVISRISRLGFTFVPTPDTVLERNDILTVVGAPSNLDKYEEKIGHRSHDINQTDILSLGFGLGMGVLLGLVEFGIAGQSITLGIAGGPLIMAIILGHFGKIGPIVGYIPRPTRLLLQDLGLVFFLANAGINGGADLVRTVSEQGAIVFILGILVTLIPMIIGFFLAIKAFKMNILECLGGICGGMTSTPALGAIASKTDSQIPVVSYATSYPVALILMTIGAKIVISVLPLVVK